MPSALRLLILLVLPAAVVSTTPSALGEMPSDIVQTEVFKSGEGGYYCFRIPALVFTANFTLLAFAEGRGQHTRSCADHGDVHIVLKRSFDLGETWTTLAVVYSEYPAHTIGNPAPVLEEASGRVVLVSCRDNKEVLQLESSDHGATWANKMELSEMVVGVGWEFVGTGPPGGLQLPSGRLVLGTYASGGGAPGAFAIYSDDSARTWKRSLPTGDTSTGECQIVAMGMGDTPLLVMATRTSFGHYLAYSNTSGESWMNLTFARSLSPQTACQSSLLAVPYKGVVMDAHLYITQPHSTFRQNMTFFSSSTGGQDWKAEFVLWKGPSAYSSMAYHKLKVYALYERGNIDYWETLTLATFSPLIL